MSDLLRLGVIGAGTHASENLLPAVRVSSDFDIGTICTRSLQTAEVAARRWHARRATTSFDETCESSDALVVCGPPELHELVIRAALDHGLPLFVEKPPARSVSRLDSVSSRTSVTPVFVDYNMRFSTAWGLAQAVLPEQDVRLLKIAMLARKPAALLWDCETILESSLLAVGIHAFDMALATFGVPSSLTFATTELGASRFALNVTLAFSEGRTAVLELGNYSNSFETRIEFVGEHARTVIDNLTTVRVFDRGAADFSDTAVESLELSGLQGGFDRNGYAGALKSFAKTIREGAPNASDLRHSRSILTLIEDITGSDQVPGRDS